MSDTLSRVTRSGNVYGSYDAPLDTVDVCQVSGCIDGLVRDAIDDENARFEDPWEDDPTPLSSQPPSPVSSPPPSPSLMPQHGPPDGPTLDDDAMVVELPRRTLFSTPLNATSSTKPKTTERDPNSNISDRARHKREKEQKKRNAKPANKTSTYKLRSSISKRLRAHLITSIKFSAVGLPHSGSGAWCGKFNCVGTSKSYSVEELRDKRFSYLKWDGKKTVFIIDSARRIIVILIGRPSDDARPEEQRWTTACKNAARVMREAREDGERKRNFANKDVNHRRGKFLAMASGVSFGGGQMRPGNLVLPRPKRRIMNKILDHSSIKRIAGFQSSTFASYCPKLFGHYAQVLDQLFQKHPGLRRPFSNSIFPTVTTNCGPRSSSYNHFDKLNKSNGMCLITSLSEDDFDYTKGGHFVLFSLKLVVEFPPGATVALPSATLEHGNTPLPNGATRCSLTQYAPAGLFRWVEYGFQSAKTLLSTVSGKKKRAALDGDGNERWLKALDLFSTPESLEKDRRRLASNN